MLKIKFSHDTIFTTELVTGQLFLSFSRATHSLYSTGCKPKVNSSWQTAHSSHKVYFQDLS